MRLVFSLVAGTEFLMIYLPAGAPGCILLFFFPTSSGCQLLSHFFFSKFQALNSTVSIVTDVVTSLAQPLSIVTISHGVCIAFTKRVTFSVSVNHSDGKVLLCMFCFFFFTQRSAMVLSSQLQVPAPPQQFGIS